MRIESIQNFAATAFDKCCKPRKSDENTPSNNNLERSPVMDTVSFGKFGGRYERLTKSYVLDKLIDGDINAYDTLLDSIYLSIEPTEETVNDPSRNIYKAKLISYKEFEPYSSDIAVEQIDRSMKRRVEDFNKLYGYENGWEKHLTTTKDFEKAAELAEYLNENGLFRRAGDSYDSMRDMSSWCYDHLAQ